MKINNWVQISKLGNNLTEEELLRIFLEIEDPLLLELDEFNEKISEVNKLLAYDGDFNSFIFENDRYSHINYSDIILGDWIEITEAIKDFRNPNLLISLLWRDNEGICFDKEEVSDLDYKIMLVSLKKFNKYKDELSIKFAALYDYDPEDEEEITDEEKFVHPSTQFQEIKKNTENAKQERWGLWLLAFSFAKYDITKLGEVLKLNLEYVLSIALMVKDMKIEINPVSHPPTPF